LTFGLGYATGGVPLARAFTVGARGSGIPRTGYPSTFKTRFNLAAALTQT